MNNKPALTLPPIKSLPFGIYPPSAYPTQSFFESSSLLLPSLIIPARRTGEMQKLLKDVVFTEPKRKSVYPLEEGVDYKADDCDGGYDSKKERKIVLVRGGESNGNVDCNVTDDPVFEDARIKSLLESAQSNTTNSDSTTSPPGRAEIRKSQINLPASPYSLLTVDQVLRHLLPMNLEEIPSSFEIAGHIAHLNLRSESLPYKYLIGKAIMDKNPRIRVVVNKIGNIENEFRTFPMEILAGEGLDLDILNKLCENKDVEDVTTKDFTVDANAEAGMQIQCKIGQEHASSLMEVQLKEHGCRFKLDFASVYWNSRLQGEHGRLVQYIVQHAQKSMKDNGESNVNGATERQCIVADAMAGVGPFAIPLTSANSNHYHSTPITCHANDLNPVSFKYLQTNAKLNRCFADRLTCYNLDAREFIHKMNEVNPHHFIMNLPAMAPEFLDAFRGWKFDECDSVGPIVHVHCFGEKARGPEDTERIEKDVLQRCEVALGCVGSLTDSKAVVEVRVIRDVGPRKNMLCVSFRLPREVEGVEKLVLDNNESQSGSAEKRPRDAENDGDSSSIKRSKGT